MTINTEVADGIDGPDTFARAFGLSEMQMERLKAYAELLQRWQRAVNLVAPDSLPALWSRHFADSAQLVPLIADSRICLDFGSGAGFPGLVCAVLMADRADMAIHLVESNARKCAFLREVARQTGTSVEIHNARIEDVASRGRVADVDVVMARAVAPLDRLIVCAEPYMSAGAFGLFPKGRRAAQEVAEAQRVWRFQMQMHASITDPEGRIMEVRGVRRLEDEAR